MIGLLVYSVYKSMVIAYTGYPYTGIIFMELRYLTVE